MPIPGAAVQQSLVIGRSLPLANADSTAIANPPRGGRYGEQVVLNPQPTALALADEGTVIVASMAPGQTAINFGVTAAWANNTATVVLINGDNPANPNARRIFPRKLHWNMSTAPASGTALYYTTFIDNINRQPTTITGSQGVAYSSGSGTAFQAIANNTNMANSNPVLGRCYFPITNAGGSPPAVPAAGPAARQLIGNGFLRAQIPIVGDDYNIIFGVIDEPGPAATTAAPNAVNRIVVAHEPVALDPGHCLLVTIWAPSNATTAQAASQMDFSWIER